MAETVVCVGAIVRRESSVLLVRQSPGHSLEGQWTIPWGQLDRGESPTAAALREVREEAGVIARVDGLLGVQELPEPWLGMLGMLFLCTHISGTPTPDMRETDAARYFSGDQNVPDADPLEPGVQSDLALGPGETASIDIVIEGGGIAFCRSIPDGA